MTLPRLMPLSFALAGMLIACGASAQRTPPEAADAATASPPAATAEDTREMEKAAELAAMGWLLLLDRRDWGRAWDTAAGMFRTAVPLAAWMEGIPKARAPLGKLVERTAVEVVYKKALQGHPPGDYVTLLFNAHFERKPDAQEMVTTVREPDGKWRVTGYSTR